MIVIGLSDLGVSQDCTFNHTKLLLSFNQRVFLNQSVLVQSEDSYITAFLSLFGRFGAGRPIDAPQRRPPTRRHRGVQHNLPELRFRV